MEDDRETVRLWRVNRTIHELVRDRGYQVADDEISIDLETFKAEYAPTGGSVDRTKLNFFTEHSEHENQRLFVFYSLERSVGVKTMRQFISIMEERDIQRGIIIWPEKMTSAARKVIDAMRGTFHLEDFEEAFLLVNITHHHLVPKHEPLYPEEKKDLLQRYRLKETQLPRIQQADPVARYFGLQRGQVVKIIRPSETSAFTTYQPRPHSPRREYYIVLSDEVELIELGSAGIDRIKREHRNRGTTMAGLEESNIAPTSTAMTPETSTATALAPATASSSSKAKDDESNAFYPPPTSSYYFGPPDSTKAFGEPVTGKPGVHLPKEIVRIERDYSSGELPQFHSSFPMELEGRISPTTFSEIINDINSLLVTAHNPTRIWIDNTIAILTFYISMLLVKGHYQRTMEELDRMISKYNEETLHPVGLSLVDPRKTAFLFIELEYF